MKKRIFALMAAALLSLTLCACGGSAPQPEKTAAPADPGSAEASAPAREENSQSVLPDAGLHELEEAGEEDPAIAQRRAQAEEFVGKSAEELIAALGEPVERRYAPSCLGSGEDGELSYEGFTVYTYREGETETVKSVE